MTDRSIADRASFDHIRYAQVWEDADVLLAGLAVRPGAHLASIASAGDNCLALLTADPASVTAFDLSDAQLACLRLRMAAYRRLDHGQVLELIGSRPSDRRDHLLDNCLGVLSPADGSFWHNQRSAVRRWGVGGVGKFERYFRLFRRRVLPLVHPVARVQALMQPRDAEGRAAFYRHWNNRRWRWLLRLFFSRNVMGRLGRDPAFFEFAEGSLTDHLAARIRHALVTLAPAENPYLHWILTGQHGDVLPLALRADAFIPIRDRLDRLHLHQTGLTALLPDLASVDGWNLSDIFEYMTPMETRAALSAILSVTRPGGRLVWWNMLVPRPAPDDLSLIAHDAEAARLFAADKAFFYSALVVAEAAA